MLRHLVIQRDEALTEPSLMAKPKEEEREGRGDRRESRGDDADEDADASIEEAGA